MRNTKRRPPGPRLTRTTGYTHSRMPLDGYGFVLIVRSSPTIETKRDQLGAQATDHEHEVHWNTRTRRPE
jgi:hypothetical protein